MQQLEEEALMEECIEAMLDDDDDDGELDLSNLTNSILESSQSWSDAEARESLMSDRTTDLCHLIGLLRVEEKCSVANSVSVVVNSRKFFFFFNHMSIVGQHVSDLALSFLNPGE